MDIDSDIEDWFAETDDRILNGEPSAPEPIGIYSAVAASHVEPPVVRLLKLLARVPGLRRR